MKPKVTNFKIKDLGKFSDAFRFPRRWVLILGEKNSFSIIFSRNFSSAGLITMLIGLLMLSIFIAGTIICLTPLRSILPGYLGRSERQILEILEQRVDSMQVESANRLAYIENLNAILKDEVQETTGEIPAPADSVGRIPVDSLLPASETEKKFVADFDARAKYNQSILAPIAAGKMMFKRPVSAITEAVDDPVSGSLLIKTVSGSPVDAIYRGTVIAAYYDGTSGGTVIIQHPNEFVSTYSGLAKVYAVRGEEVKSGSRLGFLPAQLPTLKFSVWHKGTEVNPRNLIGI